MPTCRECKQEVTDQDSKCTQCGARYPAIQTWDGWGYEYKSKASLLGLPLVHISFKYGPNQRPVPAVGILSVGQFGMGIINVSQFGIGVFSLSQFTIAGYAVTQVGAAFSLVAQVGLYVDEGYGQVVKSAAEVFGGF